jgi:RNA polymerase sigma-70 factor (family 1)
MPEEKLRIVALFKEIHTGNKGAFDELFFGYHDKLLAFARQYTKQLETAEEIVSELFVKIWLKRAALLTVNNPEVYLYVAIKNACLNMIRANHKRNTLLAAWPDEQLYEGSLDKGTERFEDKELNNLLDLAIEKLPEQRRIIFSLIKEQGLKPKAVSEILGISVRTVENQLYKAVKTLADSISGYLGYHPQGKTAQKRMNKDLRLFFL